jgi:hypothetical protein
MMIPACCATWIPSALPHAHWVLDYSNFDGNLQLQIGGRTVVLGPRITARIFVEAIESVRE